MSVEHILANPSLQRLARQSAQSLSQSAPSVLSAAEVAASHSVPELASGASHLPPSSMGLGKAALAVAAGLVLFFVLGPKALKLAAKGAAVFAKTLFNPVTMTKLVNNGLFIMAAAETALPVLRKFGLSKNVANIASKATSFNGMTAMATEAFPQARNLASELLRQAPPALRQNAEGLLSKLGNVLGELKSLAKEAAPKVPTTLQAATPVARPVPPINIG